MHAKEGAEIITRISTQLAVVLSDSTTGERGCENRKENLNF